MSRLLCVVSVALIATLPLVAADEKKDDKKKTEQKSDAKPSSANDYTPVGEASGVLARGPGKSGNSIALRGAKLTVTGTRRLKAVEDDHVIELTPDAKVRFMQPPPRTDEKGHKIPYTEKELRELKGSEPNMKGYKADVEDLKAGLNVTLHLVKLKGAKGEMADKLFADRVYITGESNLPPPAEKSGKDKKDK
jgi:hypothetical protein